MVTNNHDKFNPESAFAVSFRELGLTQAMRKAGIYKRCGRGAREILVALFSLIFYHMSWNMFTRSAHTQVSKDQGYRFLANPKFRWRAFLEVISGSCVRECEKTHKPDRVTYGIVDDTPHPRKGSKKRLTCFHAYLTMSAEKATKAFIISPWDGATAIRLFLLIL